MQNRSKFDIQIVIWDGVEVCVGGFFVYKGCFELQMKTLFLVYLFHF